MRIGCGCHFATQHAICLMLVRRKEAFRYMGNPARKVGLARCDDKMVAGVGDTGREHHVSDIHLVFEWRGEPGTGLD